MSDYTVDQKVWIVHNNTPEAYIIEGFTQRKGELCCIAHNFNNPKCKTYLYGRDIYDTELDALKVVYDVWKRATPRGLLTKGRKHSQKMAECEARLRELETQGG